MFSLQSINFASYDMKYDRIQRIFNKQSDFEQQPQEIKQQVPKIKPEQSSCVFFQITAQKEVG